MKLNDTALKPLTFQHYQPRPGHPDWEDCLAEARLRANEVKGLIVKDADLTLAGRRRKRWRRWSAYKSAAGNFLVNRYRMRRGNHAFRPLYAIWTMLNSCNFRCSYCDNHQGEHYFDVPDTNRLDTEGGKKLLRVLRTGTPALYWCGGEPTMRGDLPELLDYASSLGFFPNMINTNGSLLYQRLKKPEWKNFLQQMDMVIVSLDGLDLSALNGIWGVKKAREVIVNLLMLRELQREVRFKLAVNTVITPGSVAEARAVLDLANDLGIYFVGAPVNYRHEPNRELLKMPEYQELTELILERKRSGYRIIGSERLLRMLFNAEPYTCYTTLKPHVWADGTLCFPCRAAQRVSPVNIPLTAFRSFDEAYREGRRHIDPDNFHGMDAGQCGGNCAWMQNYTTARYAEGLRRPLRSGIFSEIREFTS